MATEIRTLPAQEQRVETGPVQFGDDWPGVFIRGDNAFYFAMCLRRVIEHGMDADPLATLMLGSIADTLSSGDLTGISARPTEAGNGLDTDRPRPNEKAFESGWRAAAKWANREDLIADIGSPAYERDAAGVDLPDQREQWESHIRMEREAQAARETTTAPARLWLQVDQESPNVDESTWCQDKINDTDVLYIRADLAGVPPTASVLVNELVEQGQFYKRGDISEAEFIRAVNHYVDQFAPCGVAPTHPEQQEQQK
jgi:hypothetical protein